MDGICILANDRVYDQLVALLNSIEAIYGQNMLVCIYPYDDRTTKISAEIARRPHVQLYSDRDSIQTWDEFARDVWDTHPTAHSHWPKSNGEKYHRFGTHRRYGAFDGPFDRFVYMDADTLLISPLDRVFTQLEKSDWVVYDFQFKDLSHVYNLSSPKLSQLFTTERLQSETFCSGFYAAKKNVFNPQNCSQLLTYLRQGESEVLYEMAPDQTILNYMVMRSGLSTYNFALHLPKNETTGCCVTSDHFEVKGNVLYDRGTQLTYIHYIGLSSSLFSRVCSGENLDFPYRDVFLHYRYLHEPEKRPKFTTKPKPYNASQNFAIRALRKIGITS